MKTATALLLAALAGCAHKAGPAIDLPAEAKAETPDALERHSQQRMGTLVEIALPRTRSGPAREAALKAAWEAFAFVEREMNEWRPESPLSEVNRAAGGFPVAVGPELFIVISRSLELAAASDGAFDPSWAALRGLWKFGSAHDGTIPDPNELDARRSLVDYRHVVLDSTARTVQLKEPGMALGLGGIAKGWSVDRAADALRAGGERDFLIEAGGELYASGAPGGGGRWMAGIRDPRGPGAFASLALADEACSTSGDYERAFVKGGVRYHHIIDPRTGQPARASRSATVVAPRSMDADALAKVAFILGAPDGLTRVERLGGAALVVAADGSVHVSPALSSRVTIARPPTNASP